MRFEQQPTWEVAKRLATWANKDKTYENNRSTGSSKQEANEYALQLLNDCIQQREQGLLMKYPNRSDVERAYAPNLWGYTLNNPERAYMAECPTLLIYDKLYGEGSSTIWIHIHVTALYGASPSKDKELVNSIAIFSETFSAEVRLYKLSELMLFFGRYKAGRYDNSYQSFDTKRIGNAFLKNSCHNGEMK